MASDDEQAWVSVHDATLGISLEAPLGWSRAASDVFPVMLLAPEQDGYRASCNLSHERFDPPAPEGFEDFVRRLSHVQRTEYEAFEELGHEPLVIDNRPGILQRYQWSPPGLGGALEQLLALIVVEPGLLLEADTSTRVEGADRYLPTFRRILTSIRFLG